VRSLPSFVYLQSVELKGGLRGAVVFIIFVPLVQLYVKECGNTHFHVGCKPLAKMIHISDNSKVRFFYLTWRKKKFQVNHELHYHCRRMRATFTKTALFSLCSSTDNKINRFYAILSQLIPEAGSEVSGKIFGG
jgi:hypothetical protein